MKSIYNKYYFFKSLYRAFLLPKIRTCKNEQVVFKHLSIKRSTINGHIFLVIDKMSIIWIMYCSEVIFNA